MACLQTSGMAAAAACPSPKVGIKEDMVWFANRTQLTFTGGSNKLYTDVDAIDTAVIYRYAVHKKGNDVTDELSLNDTTGARTWVSKLAFRLLKRDGATAAAIEAIGADLVVFVATQDEKVLVLGSDAGMFLSENTSGIQADNFGETVVLANEDGSKPYELKDTDFVTTIATLVALEA